jgi:hypothetical protein
MAIQVGTHDLASLRENRFTSVAAFGEERFNEIIQADLAAHNAVVRDMETDLVTETADQQRVYGLSVDGDFQEVDEYSRVPTQMYQGGSTVGFPLKLYQYATGWTERALAKMSVGEAAELVLAREQANIRKRRAEIKKAIYLSANYTFRDKLSVPVIDLSVKRLANADSMAIPNGPDGAAFNAATHTHYVGSATLTASAFAANIVNVTEHGHGGRVIVAINYADAAAVAALTGFIPAPEVTIVPATNAAYTVQTTNSANQFNRYLGRFQAAEVWVKPWAIANYAMAYDALAMEKPLVYRVDSVSSFVGMRLLGATTIAPLATAHYEDSFGYGVWGRTSAAILYFANASYADPTIVA